jgi:voltage-gated potassium channel
MSLETWERRTDWPLTAFALLFLVAYAWPILDTGLSPGLHDSLVVVTAVLWAVFAIDFGIRVWLADARLAYLSRHWFDVPLLLLPMLRPLRALRVVIALERVGRRTAMSFRGSATVFIACAVPLVVFVAALAELDAEQGDDGANITTFGDALWWACTTITTVGYGDRFPVTTDGRLVAIGLMLSGIALVGVVTASLASWFVERIGAVEAAEDATQRELARLVVELRSIREDLAR